MAMATVMGVAMAMQQMVAKQVANMNKSKMSQKGLTVVEVLLALTVIGIILGLFSATMTSNLKVNQTTGQQSQAAEQGLRM